MVALFLPRAQRSDAFVRARATSLHSTRFDDADSSKPRQSKPGLEMLSDSRGSERTPGWTATLKTLFSRSICRRHRGSSMAANRIGRRLGRSGYVSRGGSESSQRAGRGSTGPASIRLSSFHLHTRHRSISHRQNRTGVGLGRRGGHVVRHEAGSVSVMQGRRRLGILKGREAIRSFDW